MFNPFNFLQSRKNKTTFSIKRSEQKQLLIQVLRHSRSVIEHYSIDDPKRRYTDLMLAPTLIDEAINMIQSNSIETEGLLVEYRSAASKKG